jgi:hypothetical protein
VIICVIAGLFLNFPFQVTVHLTYSACYSLTTGYFHSIMHVTCAHNVCETFIEYLYFIFNVLMLVCAYLQHLQSQHESTAKNMN